MRLIDADRLYPDCMTKDGKLAISQSQLANALTVDTYTEDDMSGAYNEGYSCGSREARTACERPQGEWIFEEEDAISRKSYRCSICDRAIVVYPSETLSFYPYCHCGADMRGEE